MKERSTTVAIIGCGVAGLAAIKSCLEEGLQPTCFERSDGVGGLWYYQEDADCKGRATVAKSTYTNASKEMYCFSDFPVPKDWPNFLRHDYMKQYCDMYADRFGLRKCIRFSTRVTRLSQSTNYETTGRWIISVKEASDGREASHEFDAVMICTGMFHNPYVPKFLGLDEFQGRVLHSHEFRKPDEFEGKRVVVVGVGQSAGEAAVDLSTCAAQVYLSVRRGAWLVSRMADDGMPLDIKLLRRYFFCSSHVELMAFKKWWNRRYGMIAASLIPNHDVLACPPLLNEELPGCIMNGSVVIKANPAKFSKRDVEFEDGTAEKNIDAVVLATGYRFKFSFQVDCPALQIKENHVPLYKHVFPLGLKHSTLSVSGSILPIGPGVPVVELQARWAARVFAGLSKLPGRSEMEAEVKMADRAIEKMSLPSQRYVGYASYADNIASEIGAKPNFLKLFFTDPVLTLRCLFGPLVPYQYRLVGPGKWDGAREAINTVWEKVLEPTRTRHIKIKKGTHFMRYRFVYGVSVVAVAGVLILLISGF